MSKILSSVELRAIIVEELTKTDKEDIKKMISKATKDDIGEITKKVLKRLYKDLSFHHPYIIDRIKV